MSLTTSVWGEDAISEAVDTGLKQFVSKRHSSSIFKFKTEIVSLIELLIRCYC
jgi:hypothetical protein